MLPCQRPLCNHRGVVDNCCQFNCCWLKTHAFKVSSDRLHFQAASNAIIEHFHLGLAISTTIAGAWLMPDESKG